MSGECSKCGEHALECGCKKLQKAIKNSLIKISSTSHEKLFINFDETEIEIVQIKRNGKTLTFPTWEFWQVLEKYHGG